MDLKVSVVFYEWFGWKKLFLTLNVFSVYILAEETHKATSVGLPISEEYNDEFEINEHHFFIGATEILPCVPNDVTHPPGGPFLYEWFVSNGQKPYEIIDDEGYLHFNHVSIEDAGNYSCHLNCDATGKITKFHHRIVVQAAPTVISESLIRYTAEKCDIVRETVFGAELKLKLNQLNLLWNTSTLETPHISCHVSPEGQPFYKVIVPIVITVAPSSDCYIICTQDKIDEFTIKIQQIIQRELKNPKGLRLSDSNYTNVPIPATFRNKIITRCEPGYVLEGEICRPCERGTFQKGQSCEPCPVNQYNEKPGAQFCAVCLDEKFTEEFGATSKEHCHDITDRNILFDIIILGGILFTITCIVVCIQSLLQGWLKPGRAIKNTCFLCYKTFYCKEAEEEKEENLVLLVDYQDEKESE